MTVKPRSSRARRAAMLESCEEPDCVYCQVGTRLLTALDDVEADASTEMLTLVRLLAATAVATVFHPGDLAEMLNGLVGQLRDDVAQLLGTKETH